MLQQGLNIELEDLNDEAVDLAGWLADGLRRSKKTLRSWGYERQFT